jgi:hypothetical protein
MGHDRWSVCQNNQFTLQMCPYYYHYYHLLSYKAYIWIEMVLSLLASQSFITQEIAEINSNSLASTEIYTAAVSLQYNHSS